MRSCQPWSHHWSSRADRSEVLSGGLVKTQLDRSTDSKTGKYHAETDLSEMQHFLSESRMSFALFRVFLFGYSAPQANKSYNSMTSMRHYVSFEVMLHVFLDLDCDERISAAN